MNRKKMSPATSDGHRIVDEAVHPYQVETNRYSHEGSGFSAVTSTWATLDEAIAAGKILWDGGCQRWVHVVGPRGAIYFMNGREFSNGDGAEKFRDPIWTDDDPKHTGRDAAAEFCKQIGPNRKPSWAKDGSKFRMNGGINWYTVIQHGRGWAIVDAWE